MRFLKISAITFLAIVFASLALADLSFEQKTTTSGMMGQPGQSYVQKVWITKNQMCMDNSAQGQKMIFDAAKNKLIIINLNQKTYSEITPEQYKKMTSGMMAMMGQEGGGLDFSIQKTGKKKKIGSWDCFEVVVSSTGGMDMKMEMWVTKDIKYEKANYDRYTEIFASQFMTEKALAEWKKIDGFPVFTTTHMTMGQMKMESTTEVTNVSYKSIPKDVFAVPAGFTKTEFKMPRMP
jgi:hypothetical protein